MILIVIATLTLFRFALLVKANPIPKPSGSPSAFSTTEPIPKRDYRPGIVYHGHWKPSLVRSASPKYTLVDMNDKGDYLFLTSPASAKYHDYLFVSKGSQQKLDRVDENTRYILTESGRLVKRYVPSQGLIARSPRSLSGPVTDAYNELRFTRYILDDGSVLNVRLETANSQQIFHLSHDYVGGRKDTLYTSKDYLSILERDGDKIWFKETKGPGFVDQDKFSLFQNGKAQSISFPQGYHSVARVSANGAIVTATFGRIQGDQPLRSYIQTGTNWRELPLPEGYVFSFVQKVMNDGLILGFVTDSQLRNFKQVVWRGDDVAILDNMDAWPKRGELSFVVRVTRDGDLYVRNVTDTASGTSDYYLLKVKQ